MHMLFAIMITNVSAPLFFFFFDNSLKYKKDPSKWYFDIIKGYTEY